MQLTNANGASNALLAAAQYVVVVNQNGTRRSILQSPAGQTFNNGTVSGVGFTYAQLQAGLTLAGGSTSDDPAALTGGEVVTVQLTMWLPNQGSDAANAAVSNIGASPLLQFSGDAAQAGDGDNVPVFGWEFEAHPNGSAQYATAASCTYCSNSGKLTNVYGNYGSTITVPSVTYAGQYALKIVYAYSPYYGGAGIAVSVNGGAAQVIPAPLVSSGSESAVVANINLPAGTDTITVRAAGSSSYAPDLDYGVITYAG
jgi:hypothetical protein